MSKNQIFAHRGIWDSQVKPNSIVALKRAVSMGFCLETDFRVSENKLVISHDYYDEKIALKDINIFDTPVAINLKEDGMLPYFEEFREEISKSNSFFFDGSIPEMYKIYKANLPHALRLSEYERELPWVSSVIWLDSFESDWWIKDNIDFDPFSTSRVVIVSPELHKREHRKVWDFVLEKIRQGHENLSICTDFPQMFLKELNA